MLVGEHGALPAEESGEDLLKKREILEDTKSCREKIR
jgi:hypothetical protein